MSKKSFGKFGGLGNPDCNINPNVEKAFNYEKRIKDAKILEKKFFEKLKNELGFIVKEPTESEDKFLGIDGYLISINNNKTKLKEELPFQLKIRNKKSEKEDILIEVIKPWFPSCDFNRLKDNAFTGKDIKCKAKLLISVAPDGKHIRLRKMEETIENAKLLANSFLQNFRQTEEKSFNNELGEAKIIQEKFKESTANLCGDIKKLVVFLNPNSFKWKKEIAFRSPL